MGAAGPPGLSKTQQEALWARWKAGYRMRDIGRVLEVDHGSVRNVLCFHGGITPRERRRGPRALTFADREGISRGIASNCSIRSIARQIGRPPSTVSREIARHGGWTVYRAYWADKRAWRSALRPKPCLLERNPELRAIVASKLALDWSPEQIAGWLKVQYPDDESMRVSHETIYRSLFIQSRGVLKKELIRHLRSGHRLRQSRMAATHPEYRGKMSDAISIRERPAEAEDRAVPGHWEGDLICGSKSSQIITLVERHSRFTMLVQVPNRETDTVVDALTHQIQKTSLGIATVADMGSRARTPAA
jgi:IS30 family transposase